ncbi:hypothetical protein [Salibacterium salarium]|nr:hypothetical protein [Salibacterium salarium]
MDNILDTIIVLVSVMVITGILRSVAAYVGNRIDFYTLLQQWWHRITKNK